MANPLAQYDPLGGFEIDNLLDVVHSIARFPLNCQSKLAHELNEVISALEMGHCTTRYRTNNPIPL